jgi:hypothetical protein
MPTTKTFDPRCYDLAELFLEDEHQLGTEANCTELAADIQRCVEDFIAARLAEQAEEEAYAAGQAADHRREQRLEDHMFHSRAAGVWIDLEEK